MYFLVQSVGLLAILSISACSHLTNFSSENVTESYVYDNRSRSGFYTGLKCSPCGLTQRNRIVGGREASIREFPWMVDIKKNGIQHCGGSVINGMNILTAAHCVRGHDVSKFVVIATVSDVFDQEAFKTGVQSAVAHPDFEPSTYDYDVAVLYLEEALPMNRGIIPVCLPNVDDDPTGTMAIVSGWGALKETANVAPQQLRKLPVPVVTNEQCRNAKGLQGQKITERMLCAGYIHGAKDACTGDSGGPLVWSKRGVWRQVGIVSWGIGCARPDYYGVYTRVTSLLDWIHANIQEVQC